MSFLVTLISLFVAFTVLGFDFIGLFTGGGA